MNAVTPARESRPTLGAGSRIAPIVPQTMEDAYRLGKAVCQAGMAPRGMDTPEKAMIAIMRGLEVGLTPMQALDKIAVVNGRPTIWGDGAMALVRASGLCVYVRETQGGQGDAVAATCEVQRQGEPEPIIRAFSVADAKRAGLWGKSGPWQQYPNRMLQMRARAFALRDGFADVLGGLYLREEIEDETRTTSRGEVRAAPSGPPRRVAHQPASAALPAPSPVDRDAEAEACVAQFERDVQHARTEQDITDCAAIVAPLEEADRLSRQQRGRIEDAIEEARARIGKAATEAEDVPEQSDEPESRADPASPDYQRGVADRKAGQKRCVIAAIRENEPRFAAWKAGWDAEDDALRQHEGTGA